MADFSDRRNGWCRPCPCVGEVYFAMCCVKMSRGLHAFHQQRADIADHRRHPVALFERVRGADGDALPGRGSSTGRRRFCSGGTASPSALRPRGSAACSSRGRGAAAASAGALRLRCREGLICYSVLGKGRSKQRPYNSCHRTPAACVMQRHGFVAAIEQYCFEFVARHWSHLRPKTSPKWRTSLSATSLELTSAPEQKFLQRRRALTGDAAGHDQIEIAQIGRNIVREAVRSDPAAQMHAERGELFRRPAGRIDPNAVQSFDPAALRCRIPPWRESWFLRVVARTSARRGGVREIENRIADDLSRAVIGDVSAAIGGMKFDVHLPQARDPMRADSRACRCGPA